jgi:hypothetical protein
MDAERSKMMTYKLRDYSDLVNDVYDAITKLLVHHKIFDKTELEKNSIVLNYLNR